MSGVQNMGWITDVVIFPEDEARVIQNMGRRIDVFASQEDECESHTKYEQFFWSQTYTPGRAKPETKKHLYIFIVFVDQMSASRYRNKFSKLFFLRGRARQQCCSFREIARMVRYFVNCLCVCAMHCYDDFFLSRAAIVSNAFVDCHSLTFCAMSI